MTDAATCRYNEWMPHSLRIALLGPPRFEYLGTPLEIGLTRSQSILYYLARADQPVTRSRLAGLFWPDRSEVDARRQLSYALYRLNQLSIPALPDEIVVTIPPHSLGFHPDLRRRLWIDSVVFEQQAEEILALASTPNDFAPMLEGLALYRGEFLQGYSLPENDVFAGWMHTERAALARLARQAGSHMAHLLARSGQPQAAIRAWGCVLAADPLEEEAHRQLMRLYYENGSRAAALQQYERLCHLLQSEVDAAPAEETTALYQAIRKNQVARVRHNEPAADRKHSPYLSTTLAEPTFVGQAEELEALRRALSPRARPKTTWIKVYGEAGIGKTSLVQVALREAAAKGLRVLTSHCHETTQEIPYLAAIEALRAFILEEKLTRDALDRPLVWGSLLAQFLPELFPAGDHPARETLLSQPEPLVVVQSILELLEALGGLYALVWFVDDLQWIDRPSLQLLTYLAGLQHLPLSVIIAYRDDPVSAELAEFLNTVYRISPVLNLHLDPLGPDEVSDLVARLVKDPRPAEVQAAAQGLIEKTRGNPFYLTEYLQAVLGQLVVETGQHPVKAADLVNWLHSRRGQDPITARLDGVIRQRLSHLSPAAQQAAQAAAVFGPTFDASLVQTVAKLNELDLITAVEELEAFRIISRVKESTYTFTHPILHHQIYNSLSEIRAAYLHKEVARVLEEIFPASSEDTASPLARHYLLAGMPEKAVAYFLLAAQRALQLFSLQAAVDNYEQALSIWPESRPRRERVTLLLDLAQAQNWKGDPRGAIQRCASALSLCEPDPDLDLVSRAKFITAEAYLLMGRHQDANDVMLPALEALKSQADAFPILLGKGLMLHSNAQQNTNADLASLECSIDQATRIFEQANHSEGLALTLFQKANIKLRQGSFREAVQIFAQITRQVDRSPLDPLTLVTAYNTQAFFLLQLGAWQEASAILRQGLEIAQASHNLVMVARVLYTKGEIHIYRAEWEEAYQAFIDGLEIAEDNRLNREICLHLFGLGGYYLARHEAQKASAHFQKAIEMGQSLDRWLRSDLYLGLARARIAADEKPAEGGREAQRKAEGLVQQALDLARHSNRKPQEMRSLRTQAALLAKNGSAQGAVDLLHGCLEHYRAVQNDLGAAQVMADLARITQTSALEDSARWQEQAQAAFTRLEALAELQELESLDAPGNRSS